MKKQENLCNSCGECINCGRDKWEDIEVCDRCETTLYGEQAFDINENLLCKECALDMLISMVQDDPDEWLKEYQV